MDFVVVIHAAEEGGYWAEVPTLPGCFAQAETVEDLLKEMREAIASHIEVLQETGEQISSEANVLIATVRLPSPEAA